MNLDYSVDKADLKKRDQQTHEYGMLIKIIEEFLDSGEETAVLSNWRDHYKSVYCCRGAFATTIYRNFKGQVAVHVRYNDECVWLERLHPVKGDSDR